MNGFIHTAQRIGWMACLIAAMVSCRKNEFMPEPQGEKIPASALPTVAAATPSTHSLFLQAWQKSNIEKLLANELSNDNITILAPDNAAFTAAGLTADAIAAAPVAQIDSLIMWHVLLGNYDPELLRQGAALQYANTPLKDLSYTVGLMKSVTNASFRGTEPYIYRHGVNMDGNDLMVDGRKLTLTNPVKVSHGWLFPVNKIIDRPRLQMKQWLEADGRFSLYLKAIELISQSYQDNFRANWYFMYGAIDPAFLLDTRKTYSYTGTPVDNEMIRFTLFAPTDDAFHNAGIMNAAQLEEINSRSDFMWAYEGMPSLDSLLYLHAPAEVEFDILFTPDFSDLEGIRIFSNNPHFVFYSNKLYRPAMDVYSKLQSSRIGELVFSSDMSSKPTIKAKDGYAPAATVTDPDNLTLQGPVQVVDRLIIPANFNL